MYLDQDSVGRYANFSINENFSDFGIDYVFPRNNDVRVFSATIRFEPGLGYYADVECEVPAITGHGEKTRYAGQRQVFERMYFDGPLVSRTTGSKTHRRNIKITGMRGVGVSKNRRKIERHLNMLYPVGKPPQNRKRKGKERSSSGRSWGGW